MWFNHKTVIFGGSAATAKKQAKSGSRPRQTSDLDKEQLADVGIESETQESRLSAVMSKFIHETRFTGYRGEIVA
ncbi:hypothetical protein FP2506_05946 [Fulvimarina pelagi HTCC2506]|uniref:DUF1127 domain-containing protein n=1 Tax=Fulvimarina pelagi HTCC2506 TaxID=314231 RepID=Q0G7K7_9HYPH|nr:hypothetical protein [Fulvimarina pelagi]EAU42357.1 hypothetical protein FP2506_05946 [Fulvimarina pelagi HTCC2506]